MRTVDLRPEDVGPVALSLDGGVPWEGIGKDIAIAYDNFSVSADDITPDWSPYYPPVPDSNNTAVLLAVGLLALVGLRWSAGEAGAQGVR